MTKEERREYGKRWRAANPDYIQRYRMLNGRPKELNRTAANIRSERWRNAHPERARMLVRDSTTRRRQGIDRKEYERLLALSSKCLICGGNFRGDSRLSSEAPVLDHDHKTGKHRGVLHRRCNMALGLFKDDLVLLRAAVAYLEKYGG